MVSDIAYRFVVYVIYLFMSVDGNNNVVDNTKLTLMLKLWEKTSEKMFS